MKTKLEIIEETSQYNLNTRAYENGCMYETSDGKHCAVGRCLTPDGLKFFMDNKAGGLCEFGIDGIDNHNTLLIKPLEFDGYLKEEYRGHEYEFWQDMQQFHDTDYIFTETGLSEVGVAQKKVLISKWCK